MKKKILMCLSLMIMVILSSCTAKQSWNNADKHTTFTTSDGKTVSLYEPKQSVESKYPDMQSSDGKEYDLGDLSVVFRDRNIDGKIQKVVVQIEGRFISDSDFLSLPYGINGDDSKQKIFDTLGENVYQNESGNCAAFFDDQHNVLPVVDDNYPNRYSYVLIYRFNDFMGNKSDKIVDIALCDQIYFEIHK